YSSTPLLTPFSDDFIFIKSDYKTLRVNISEIQFIEGSRNYVKLYTSNKKIMSLQNLKFLEKQLQPYRFIRIHKSYIISVKYIDSIEKNFVRLGQHKLPIGDSFRDSFIEFIRFNYNQY
ncbi:MAG: hypothetical protein RL335_1299, partial [Bacteroidota bacterium]